MAIWRKAALTTSGRVAAVLLILALVHQVPAGVWTGIRHYWERDAQNWGTALDLTRLLLMGAGFFFLVVVRPRLSLYPLLHKGLTWMNAAAFVPAVTFPLWYHGQTRLVYLWAVTALFSSLLSELLPDEESFTAKARLWLFWTEEWLSNSLRLFSFLLFAWAWQPLLPSAMTAWLATRLPAIRNTALFVLLPLLLVWEGYHLYIELKKSPVSIWRTLRWMQAQKWPLRTLSQFLQDAATPVVPRFVTLIKGYFAIAYVLWFVQVLLAPGFSLGWWPVVLLTLIFSLALGIPARSRPTSHVVRELFSDLPIKSIKEDQLDRTRLAESLSVAIERVPGNTSMVMGVYGGWGSGKTSVMLMARGELQKQGHTTLWLRAWAYDNQEKLANAFMQSLTDLLQKQGLTHLPWGAVQRYYNMAKSLLGERVKEAIPWANLATLFSALPTDEKLKLGKTDVNRLIARLTRPDRKLVVFIDDLDRCSHEAVLGTLAFLREVADFQRCVFVLGVDHDSVTAALEKQYGERGAEALHKVITVAVQIDVPTFDKMDKMFTPEFKKLLGIEEERARNVLRQIVQVAGRNPRRIKQVLNAISAQRNLILHGVVRSGLAPELLIYWELLRLQAPGLVSELLETNGISVLVGEFSATFPQAPTPTSLPTEPGETDFAAWRHKMQSRLERLHPKEERPWVVDSVTRLSFLLLTVARHNLSWVTHYLGGQNEPENVPWHLPDWLTEVWEQRQTTPDLRHKTNWVEAKALLHGLMRWKNRCLQIAEAAPEFMMVPDHKVRPPMMADNEFFRQVLLDWVQKDPWPLWESEQELKDMIKAELQRGGTGQIEFVKNLAVKWRFSLSSVLADQSLEPDVRARLDQAVGHLLVATCKTTPLDAALAVWPELGPAIRLQTNALTDASVLKHLIPTAAGEKSPGTLLKNASWLVDQWEQLLKTPPDAEVRQRWQAAVNSGLLDHLHLAVTAVMDLPLPPDVKRDDSLPARIPALKQM